jgi:hypothetical protein
MRWMPPHVLLVFQMVMSLVAWSLVAWVLVLPAIASWPRRRVLLVLTIPQLFRHLGATQLSPMVGPDMPPEWAWHVAGGDTLTVVLAIVAVIALQRDHSWAIAAAWAVHVVGLLDASFNGFNAARLGVAPHLGAAWYIVAFAVPLVYVAHVLALRELLRRRA